MHGIVERIHQYQYHQKQQHTTANTTTTGSSTPHRGRNQAVGEGEGSNGYQDQPPSQQKQGEEDDNHESERISVIPGQSNSVDVLSNTHHQDDDNVDGDDDENLFYFHPPSTAMQQQQQQQQQQQPFSPCWTHSDHFLAAAKIAPVWFLANWTYNTSLAYTSITSSTVLASTGSLFTFGFAVCTYDEQFRWIKLGGVLMGMMGCVLTTMGDTTNASENNDDDNDNNLHWRRLFLILSSTQQSSSSSLSSLLGDGLGLLSAVGYGAYAVQTRLLCPRDERLYSMQILLGYIGVICMIGLSPLALYQVCWSSSSSSKQLTWVVFGFLVVKGIFDNVISDYLWLRAVVLTNATVATVGLGLTIPLAFLSDIFVTDSNVISGPSIVGALCVLCGFVLVNIGTNEEVEAQAVSGEYEIVNGTTLLQDDEELEDNSGDAVRGEQELSDRRTHSII